MRFVFCIGFTLLLIVFGCSDSSLEVPNDSGYSLKDVNDFMIQLQNIDLDAIGNTKFDLVIIDYSRDGSEELRFRADEIRSLKVSPGGRKIVISYISIGEASDFRWYWDPSWDSDRDGIPDPDAPPWLGPGNPDWPGSYKVKYWDSNWKSIVYTYLDKILEAEFDGVFLDIIDAYIYWGPGGESGLNRETAEQEMVQFVKEIAHYTRVLKGKSDFIIIPNNGEGLSRHSDYVNTVSGILRESVWYVENTPRSSQETEYVITNLDVFKENGKVVFVLDYVTDQSLIGDFYNKARAKGYIPYATVRMLDRITVNPGYEPD